MNSSIFLQERDLVEFKAGKGVFRIILGYDSDLMLVKVKFDPGISVDPHHHTHSQSSYIAKGSFKVTIGGEMRILHMGEAFYVPPDVEHSVISLEESEIIDAFNPAREDFLE